MLTNKLLAALGIAGALTVGATADASANPYFRPAFRAPVAYRAPIYRRPFFAPRPVVVSPGYAPVYQRPVVYGPAWGAPVYRAGAYGGGWHHPFGHGYGRRW